MIKKGKLLIPLLAAFFLLMMTTVVSAHVTVQPSESTTNAYEKYTVRVPVEKDNNTTKVKIKVPDGVTLVSVLPMDDWDYKMKKGEDQAIKSVTWTAKNGGIGPNEFIEFAFIAANPSEPGKISWKAYQTYDDGSVVEWVESPDADEPASVTEIKAEDAAAPHEDNGTSTTSETTQDSTDNNTESGSTSWIVISLSVIAILLSLISLFRKRA